MMGDVIYLYIYLILKINFNQNVSTLYERAF